MIDATLDKINKFVPTKWQWILSHEGFRRYFKNTGWMFFGQMFSLLVSFFIGAWIARYLGPGNYGIVSYVVAFVGLFSFINSLGTDGIINRELVNYPEKKDELLGTGFSLRLLGGVTAFIFIVISAFVFNHDYLIRTLLILFGLTSILQAPFIINIFFQSQVRAKESFKVQLAGTFVSSVLKIILILVGGGIFWLILIYSAESLWQAIFLFYFYKKDGLKVSLWNFKMETANNILRDSWPLMLSTAATFIYLRIDQVMISKMMNDSAVGIYAAGVKITEIFYFIPGIICTSLFPAIINAKKTDESIYRNRLRNLYILLGLLSFLISLSVFILARPVISFIFGSQYLDSVPVLRVYIWSCLSMFLGTAATFYFMTENKTKTIFLINFLAMALNIGFNLLLIPVLGITGSAWATLIAYSILPLWLLFSKKHSYEV